MVGLLVAPLSAPVLWVVLLGVGQGCMIALGLTLIAVRGRTPGCPPGFPACASRWAICCPPAAR
ncbi:hypothetical protein HML84_08655 [Alcanivorax sp. IO_7]|nr:hypothetical protein HML84_08655 [Alcanivorax sp. IO_7]